jgi:hypothetical protein
LDLGKQSEQFKISHDSGFGILYKSTNTVTVVEFGRPEKIGYLNQMEERRICCGIWVTKPVYKLPLQDQEGSGLI